MQNIPSDDEFDASYQALRSVVTHPEFQSVLAEIEKLPQIERLQATFTRLTPQALAARGIPIPAGLSITTDASQDSAGPTTNTADVAATRQNTSHRPGSYIGTRICIPIPFTNKEICFRAW